jgi:hypothetical protein
VVLYPYVAALALDGNTRAVAANALGQVYAKADTSFTTPLAAIDAAGLAVELWSSADGVLPNFFVDGHTAVVWKSGDWKLPLVTSEPVPGADGSPGASVTAAELVGDKLAFVRDDGVKTPPITLPTGAGGSDSGVAGYVGTPGSATRTALDAAVVNKTGLTRNDLLKVWSIPNFPDRPNVQIGGLLNGSAIEPTAIHSVILQPGGPGYNNIIGGDGTATVGTSTPNTVSPDANNVSVAVIAGYDNVVGSIADKIISDHSYTEMGGAGHNAIFGGQGHKIRSTAKHAAIFGGDRNDIGGNYSFATGLLNQILGVSCAASGQNNSITNASLGSTVTGRENALNGSYAQADGYQNSVQGSYSSARGQQGIARGAWLWVKAAGQFTKKGDCQAVETIFRTQTTSATTKVMGTANTGLGPLLEPNSAVTFTMQVMAIEPATGATKAWRVEGTTRRGATGGLIAVGTPTITSAGADASAAGWSIATATSGGSGYLILTVTGEAAKTINWAAKVSYMELGF